VSLRRSTSRLGRAFGALVLAALPLAAVEACDDDTGGGEPAPGPDVTTTNDAPAAEATTGDAAEDNALPPLDAACQVVTEILDAGIDVDPPCRYTLPCGIPPESAFVIRGCELFRSQPDENGDASLGCAILPSDGCQNDAYAPPASGVFSFECSDCLGGGGRRPRGLTRPDRRAATTPAGAYLALLAHEEAASVHAFARLSAELREHGAPRPLVDAAVRCVADEERHARTMAREARRRGATVAAPRVGRRRRRGLEAVARENAAEGCVRETFGALLLRWQAEHADAPELRRLFARIAADETRHAALSWEVARWAEQRLDARARARVAASRRVAARALAEQIATREPTAADALLGVPSKRAARALLDGLVAHLALA
jgi:hypothetical protein